jgi:molybdopterin synthase catalytic subunit
MTHEIIFTGEPIVPPAVPALREIGASVEFSGIVRETEGDAKLEGLRYEAYEPMARRKLDGIIAELAASHECGSVLFIHRLGWVPVGEASLFIRVLAKHRGPALRMCGEIIERLKADVPVWKAADDGAGAPGGFSC